MAHLNLALLVIVVLAADPDACSVAASDMGPIEITVVPVDPISDVAKDLKKQDDEEKKKELDAKGQVVELPKPENERRPDKARFVSEYDSKTRKETQSKAAYRAGRLISRQPMPVKQRATPRERRKVERKLMKLAMRRAVKTTQDPDLPRSDLPDAADGKEQPKKEETKKQPAQQVVKGPEGQKQVQPQKKVSLKDLKLSQQELAKAVGTRVKDALGDVEEGEQTLLNSKRWRFASFFNRVKRQVAQNWHPNTAYRRRDPSGNIFGFKDRLTVLRVRLNEKGELKAVHLERASGVGFLDDEAVKAFRLAQPFPNPPKALVDDKSKTISFRFGFLFEISQRPSFKVFRYR
ncbi:MAG: TonB family protein [Deltaproteobacteria bacterium]|nr:TonB family protein [Deltaproteobacteria bacterium]